MAAAFLLQAKMQFEHEPSKNVVRVQVTKTLVLQKL